MPNNNRIMTCPGNVTGFNKVNKQITYRRKKIKRNIVIKYTKKN